MYQVSFTVDRRIYMMVIRNVSLQDALIIIRKKLANIEGLVIVEVKHE